MASGLDMWGLETGGWDLEFGLQGLRLLFLQPLASGLPPPHRHLYAVFRTQGEGGIRHDRLVGNEAKLESLSQRRQHQRPFDHGHVIADANARTAAEGEVGVAMPAFIVRRQETARI